MNAPVCPTNRPQPTPPARPARIPTPPMASDLPSLIRSINISLDVLRQITTSLTVNNTWEDRPPPGVMVYDRSEYPEWSQISTTKRDGYIYYKQGTKVDKKQRAHVVRTDIVEFVNRNSTVFRDDEIFQWKYLKPLDSDQFGSP